MELWGTIFALKCPENPFFPKLWQREPVSLVFFIKRVIYQKPYDHFANKSSTTEKFCQWNFGGSFFQKCLKLSTLVLLREFEFFEKPYSSEPGIKNQSHQWPRATFWKFSEAPAPCKCFSTHLLFFVKIWLWVPHFEISHLQIRCSIL